MEPGRFQQASNCFRFAPMNMRRQMRHNLRTLVALAAAYAVALQALLLAVGGPFAGAALPICSSVGPNHAGHSAPAHQGDCCPGTCLGSCCGTSVCPAPGPALAYAPAPLQTVAAAFALPPPLPVRVTGAHRSRAPPQSA